MALAMMTIIKLSRMQCKPMKSIKSMNRNKKKLYAIREHIKTVVLRTIGKKRKLTKADWNKRQL